jgi:hypothetical protein
MNRRGFLGALAIGFTALAATTRLAETLLEPRQPKTHYANPWNWKDVLADVEGGDTIVMAPGFYGHIGSSDRMVTGVTFIGQNPPTSA